MVMSLILIGYGETLQNRPLPYFLIMSNQIEEAISFFLAVLLAPIILFGGLGYATYIGSPQNQYFTTLKTVMGCRKATKPQKVEDLDVICGKIPQVSDFIKEVK